MLMPILLNKNLLNYTASYWVCIFVYYTLVIQAISLTWYGKIMFNYIIIIWKGKKLKILIRVIISITLQDIRGNKTLILNEALVIILILSGSIFTTWIFLDSVRYHFDLSYSRSTCCSFHSYLLPTSILSRICVSDVCKTQQHLSHWPMRLLAKWTCRLVLFKFSFLKVRSKNRHVKYFILIILSYLFIWTEFNYVQIIIFFFFYREMNFKVDKKIITTLDNLTKCIYFFAQKNKTEGEKIYYWYKDLKIQEKFNFRGLFQ